MINDLARRPAGGALNAQVRRAFERLVGPWYRGTDAKVRDHLVHEEAARWPDDQESTTNRADRDVSWNSQHRQLSGGRWPWTGDDHALEGSPTRARDQAGCGPTSGLAGTELVASFAIDESWITGRAVPDDVRPITSPDDDPELNLYAHHDMSARHFCCRRSGAGSEVIPSSQRCGCSTNDLGCAGRRPPPIPMAVPHTRPSP